jgi:hypothetical protein
VSLQRSAPSARTWFIAAVELIGALALARAIVGSDRGSAPQDRHPMPGMSDMPSTPLHEIAWTWPIYTAGAAAAAAMLWWVLHRNPVAAVTGAVAALIVIGSVPVRVLVVRSHLVAMIELEILLVLIPLLVVTALPDVGGDARGRLVAPRRSGWTWWAVSFAVTYSALLIAVHLPAVHHRGAALGSAPLFLVVITPLIGVGYWFAVLRTAGVVSRQVRRAVLLGAQEVAAFIGLLSLFGAWAASGHHAALGLSTAWDQRLGGIVMIAACALVTIPLARRLRE